MIDWKESEYMDADEVEMVVETERKPAQTLPLMTGVKNKESCKGLAIDWIGPEQLKALDDCE